MAAGGIDAASDLELGQALRDGDEAALAALYDRHLRGVYDFVARVVRDPSGAEDITQMTFIRAWEGRLKLRDPTRVKAWLFTIAHNLALNHVTRGRKTESIDEKFDLATPAAGPEAEVEAKDAAQLVWDAAASLEPRQYAVLDLSLRRDLATPEIAEVLGVSSSHAAVLLNRAREALGNAVRYLLVARRRDHCQRLADLVPAGLQSLTPDQRTTVDRHMRRCPDCQGLGHRLTRPAELFGGLLPLPVPSSLRHERRQFVMVAARRPGEAPKPSAAWRPGRPGRPAALAGLALLLLATIGGGVYLGRALPARGPVEQSAGLKGLHPFPTGRFPSPSPSTSPAASPTASPGDVGPPNGAAAGAASAFGESALTAAGNPGRAGGGAQPGGNAAPGSTPATTPPPPPLPPPEAPSFAVTGIKVTADDLPATGCLPVQTFPLLYKCNFTVYVNVTNAQNGSTVTGMLIATARRPGKVETTQVPFSITAPWDPTPVQAAFTFPPCQPIGNQPGSTALATTQQPNATSSASVTFGTFSPC
jgi:RNA polymerase sigma factor (sigma-70 family)